MTRLDQAVFDAEQGTLAIERMLAGRLFRLASEAVGELAAIVGQQFDDLHRRGRVQAAQEVGATGLALIAIDPQEDPSRGAVDGDEQVAPSALVGHLRQVFDVHVDEAGRVVLEGFAHDRRVLVLDRAATDPMTLHTARQAGARDRGIEELPHHHQQVIQRQPERAANLHRHGLLRGGQRAMQGVRPV